MAAPRTARVQATLIAALLLSVADAALVRAQDELDETPETTLSDKPAAPAAPALSPEEADKQARALFKQGKGAFEEGQYRDAWDYFRRAYLLSKRPELLYNVGQSADRMRMDREALEAFRLYLKNLPNAANRREVENRVRALEERLAATGGVEGGPSTLGAEAAAEENQLEAENAAGKTKSEGGEDEPPKPPPAGGQPGRNGWYLRLSLGVGLLTDAVRASGFKGTLSSGTGAAQLMVGYGIDSSVVLGAGLLFDWSFSPHFSSSSVGSDLNAANLTMLAAFVDYFLAPAEDGWHLMGALAIAGLALSDQGTGSTLGNKTATGGALMVGGGYEWPIDREWALGAIGRLVIARLSQDSRSHLIFAPSIAATVTWY